MTSAKTKILVTGKMTGRGLNKIRESKNLRVEYAPNIKGKDLFDALRDTDGLIIRTETPITRELLEHAPRLKIICRAGIGVDHIDLDACAEKQIVVMNTPASNRISAAEHTLGLILGLARMIPQASLSIKNGHWDRDKFIGVELREKTLGIVGLGNIGQQVALRALAFSMNVIACDPYLDPGVANKINVELLPLDQVLSRSDFISIHVPLTKETKSFVSSSFFNKTKPGAFFVNTSRGKVCVEKDLVEVLNKGHIRGAALDVFEEEPLKKDSPLLQMDNIILTPHTAGQTFESNENMSLDASTQVRDFFERGIIVNTISPIRNL